MMSILVTGGTDREQDAWVQNYVEGLGIYPADFNRITGTPGKSIGIDEMRTLKRWLTVKPLSGEKKAAVVAGAENLTVEAQNTLLKLLEEPPDKAVIILGTTSKHRLLPTVISRCLVVSLKQSFRENEETSAGNTVLPTITHRLPSGTLARRLEYAALLAANPQDATLWLEETMRRCHKELFFPVTGTRLEDLKMLLQLEKVCLTRVNLRLALEHFFLHW